MDYNETLESKETEHLADRPKKAKAKVAPQTPREVISILRGMGSGETRRMRLVAALQLCQRPIWCPVLGVSRGLMTKRRRNRPLKNLKKRKRNTVLAPPLESTPPLPFQRHAPLRRRRHKYPPEYRPPPSHANPLPSHAIPLPRPQRQPGKMLQKRKTNRRWVR